MAESGLCSRSWLCALPRKLLSSLCLSFLTEAKIGTLMIGVPPQRAIKTIK